MPSTNLIDFNKLMIVDVSDDSYDSDDDDLNLDINMDPWTNINDALVTRDEYAALQLQLDEQKIKNNILQAENIKLSNDNIKSQMKVGEYSNNLVMEYDKNETLRTEMELFKIDFTVFRQKKHKMELELIAKAEVLKMELKALCDVLKDNYNDLLKYETLYNNLKKEMIKANLKLSTINDIELYEFKAK
jgi:hypothetical protein